MSAGPAQDAGPQPGATLELRIERLGFGGAGIAAAAGLRCRVPKTLPGERVRGRVVRRRGASCTVQVLEVLEPAPTRIAAPCPHFARCGGCSLQHLACPDQLADKTARLRHRLQRALGEPAAALLQPPVAAPQPLGYRNRNLFAVDGNRIGFVDPLAREVLDVDACPLATPATQPLLATLREWLRGAPGARDLGLLAVQCRTGRDGAMVVLVPDAARVAPGQPAAALPAVLHALAERLPGVSLWVAPKAAGSRAALGGEFTHLAGPERITEQVGPFALSLSPRTFAQVHGAVAALLCAAAASALAPVDDEPVLDLFSGTGALALHLGAGGAPVLGVERDHRSVQDAARAAGQNGLPQVTFRAGRAEVIARRLFLRGQRFPRVALNPPRTGLPRDLPVWLPRLGARRLVYVSCSPATLVRDLVLLGELGFGLASLQPFDMFPQTYHLEVLAVLRRGG